MNLCNISEQSGALQNVFIVDIMYRLVLKTTLGDLSWVNNTDKINADSNMGTGNKRSRISGQQRKPRQLTRKDDQVSQVNRRDSMGKILNKIVRLLLGSSLVDDQQIRIRNRDEIANIKS